MSTASDTIFRRVRADHRSEIAQDYVELIAALIEETGVARTSDIARRLGVSGPTVNKTLKRLHDEGLIEQKPYAPVFLSAAGRKLALESRKRHRVVVAFLIAAGVPPAIAEMDAEGMEHHVSAGTFAAMKRFIKRADAGSP